MKCLSVNIVSLTIGLEFELLCLLPVSLCAAPANASQCGDYFCLSGGTCNTTNNTCQCVPPFYGNHCANSTGENRSTQSIISMQLNSQPSPVWTQPMHSYMYIDPFNQVALIFTIQRGNELVSMLLGYRQLIPMSSVLYSHTVHTIALLPVHCRMCVCQWWHMQCQRHL